VLIPCFISWNKRSRNVPYAKKNTFLSYFVHKCVYISVSEHFSFAMIIHPPDRCGISRSWLHSMLITQVHLVQATQKCAVLSHNTMPQSFEGACNWHADCRNVHFFTISCLQCHFREFGSTSNQPHNRVSNHASPWPSYPDGGDAKE
jgi:hypothetical protein